MGLLKKIATVATVMSLVASNFAMAQSQGLQQRATDSITAEILRIKEQGGRVENEQGQEVSAAQIVTGQVSTLVYVPADGKNLKYVYKLNQQTQAVTLAILNQSGERLGARSFAVDSSISAEQNVLKMRQTMNSLLEEVSRLAKNENGKASRIPASEFNGLLLALNFINAMLLGFNVFMCVRDVKKNALNCGIGVFLATMILINH